MANDIANISGTTIRVGSVVVKAPKKSATSNNTIANSDYDRDSSHFFGITNIQAKYDARFDDPRYYSGDTAN
tara:strand:+ start:24 stop:239 length:216 start_codon:yes stop_codon:yes gene_type:complete